MITFIIIMIVIIIMSIMMVGCCTRFLILILTFVLKPLSSSVNNENEGYTTINGRKKQRPLPEAQKTMPSFDGGGGGGESPSRVHWRGDG